MGPYNNTNVQAVFFTILTLNFLVFVRDNTLQHMGMIKETNRYVTG
jgi:hypothetical protein